MLLIIFFLNVSDANMASLYSIHHSDSPSTVLVTPCLTRDNYGAWSRAITMALRAKNKFGIMDGSLSILDEEDEILNWQRWNDLVSSWILDSVMPEIRPSILYVETAAQVEWSQRSFHSSNAPKIYQLKKSISDHKQEDMFILSSYTQLKSRWDEFGSIFYVSTCICGNAKSLIEQQQQDRAMEFLKDLPDNFTVVQSQILLMEPFSSIQRIYNLVHQEEKQEEINVWTTPSIDFAGLNASRNPGQNYGKRQRQFCEHYNRHRHMLATCFQIHGFIDKPATKHASVHTTGQLSTRQ